MTWQLRAHYENNGENIWQVQVENGIAGEFVKPRTTAPDYFAPNLNYTSHGPKIWFNLSYGDWNFEKNRIAQGAATLYQNEIVWI